MRPDETDGAVAETLDAPTDASPPPTVTGGAFTVTAAALVEPAASSTPTVGVLDGPLGAGGSVGTSTVMVGVVSGGEGAFTVTVGVATVIERVSSASGNDRAGEL